MSIRFPPPLPECLVCEVPTRRDTHRRTGGYCSQCAALRPVWVPTPEQLAATDQLAQWQDLATTRGREAREQAAARAAQRVDELAARRARRRRP